MGRLPEVVPIEGVCPQEVQAMTLGTTCPTLFEQCVGSFTSCRNVSNEELRDAACGLLYLSEKTRESSHLQIYVITKAALSTQLFKDPECWSSQGLNPRPPPGGLNQ